LLYLRIIVAELNDRTPDSSMNPCVGDCDHRRLLVDLPIENPRVRPL
jgi:hypothetical protein